MKYFVFQAYGVGNINLVASERSCNIVHKSLPLIFSTFLKSIELVCYYNYKSLTSHNLWLSTILYFINMEDQLTLKICIWNFVWVFPNLTHNISWSWASYTFQCILGSHKCNLIYTLIWCQTHKHKQENHRSIDWHTHRNMY